jgi:hypothetical protein
MMVIGETAAAPAKQILVQQLLSCISTLIPESRTATY